MKHVRQQLINPVQWIVRTLTGSWHDEDALCEQYFHDLFDHAADAIVMITYDGIVQDVNPAACRLYALHREELLGQQAAHLLALGHWASTARHLPALVRGEIECIDVLASIANGRTVPVEVRASEISQHGRCALLVQLRNVSERKQLEAQLQQALKMESVGRLACGVAHDFNSLLTVIRGHVDLALACLTPADPLVSDLHEIQVTTERAGRLTHQLLAFARQQAIELRMVDLNAFILDLSTLLCHMLGETIELVPILASDRLPIHADRGQLEQLLMNLAINARDAMPGGGKLVIETRIVRTDDTQRYGKSARGGCVRLTVRDSGMGMNETVKRRLFEPFYTTKAADRGMGLGLAIIHQIVKQHGAHIEVDSTLGQGTAFTIDFPHATDAS